MVARQLAIIICILASISLIEGNNVTTAWTTWAVCSESCSPGIRYRIRICKSSDKSCTSSQIEPCNTNACNRTNVSFRDTACNATCNNTGWLIRTRYCLDPTKPINESCSRPTYYPCIGSCVSTSGSTQSIQHASFVTIIPINQQSTTGLPCQYNSWTAIAVTGWALLLVNLLLILGFVIYKRKKFNQASDRNENTNQVSNAVRVKSPEYEEFSSSGNQQPIRSNGDLLSKSTYEVPMTNKQKAKLGIMSYGKDDYVEINS